MPVNFAALLEERLLECRSADTQVAFWDVDAPATLARVEASAADRFRVLIPAKSADHWNIHIQRCGREAQNSANKIPFKRNSGVHRYWDRWRADPGRTRLRTWELLI